MNEDFVVPDLPEPITAWRCFNIIPSSFELGSKLVALNRQGNWLPDGTPTTAVCWRPRWVFRAPCDVVPSPPSLESIHGGKGCGLYAFKDTHHLAVGYGLPYEGFGHYRVWAEVQLWGNVYEHEHGYRAQHGRVVSLLTVAGHGPNIDDVRGALGEVAVRELPITDDLLDALAVRYTLHRSVHEGPRTY